MLLERFESYIERLIAGVLGFRADLPDIVTQVFVLALERIQQLKVTTVLQSWIGGLAVLAARDHLRHDRRRRWLRYVIPGSDDADDGPAIAPECCELLRGAYRALARLPDDERIAFSLRHISDLEPADLAAVCSTDLQTIERRIARGMARFRAETERDPVLRRYGQSPPPAAPIALGRRPRET
jgi:RNA polymerase sigma-70 factor (ECF subfamily)